MTPTLEEVSASQRASSPDGFSNTGIMNSARLGDKEETTKSRRSWCLTACLALALLAPLSSGCRVNDDDITAWSQKASGPRKLVAVLQHDKYSTDLRVQAALTLIEMKPRGGQAVGLVGNQEFLGLLDGLRTIEPQERKLLLQRLLPSLLAGIEKPIDAEGNDPSLPFKDAAFALLTDEKTQFIEDAATREQLDSALIKWSNSNFAARLNNSNQLYGMEQVLRYLKAPALRGLSSLIEPDFEKLLELSHLLKELADPATKKDASKRVVLIAEQIDSKKWLEKQEPRVVESNQKAGLKVSKEQLKKQLQSFREEELSRVFNAMKNIGQKPAVDFLLHYATDDSNPEKLRVQALASLADNLEAKNSKQAQRLLSLLACDTCPDSLRDVAAQRVAEFSRAQVVEGLYELFDNHRWQLRWIAASTLLKMSQAAHLDEFMKKLGQVEHMAITEPLSYGPLIHQLPGIKEKQVLHYASRKQPTAVRLSALAYFYEHGSSEQTKDLQPFVDDSTKVPSCPKEAQQCAWSCSVPGKTAPEIHEILSVGDFTQFCLLPAMKARQANPDRSAKQKSSAAQEKK